MITVWHSPKCRQCGELNTPDDCKCCRDCRCYPCECICSACGEHIDRDSYMDFCECEPEADGTLPRIQQ